MDREKALERFVENYMAVGEKTYAAMLGARGEAALKEGLNELAACFLSLCRKAVIMQGAGELGEVQAITFSFLHTALPERKGIYRIDVCDGTWLLQEHECAATWAADFAFAPFFSMFSAWKQEAAKAITGVRDVDMDILALYMANLWPRKVSDAQISEWAPTFAGFDEYKDLKKSANCCFSIGEYRDENLIIYEENPKEGGA